MNQLPTSKRKFTLILPLDNFNYEYFAADISIRNILQPKGKDGEDFEYIYALGDLIDKVMDLRPLDVLPFQPNRDDKESKALIIRIK